MAITINGSGSISGISAGGLPDGVVTADDLASTLDLSGKTVTLPSGTGGKVLQVVHKNNSQYQGTSSTSFTAQTDLDTSITPSSTSSKILVQAHLNGLFSNSGTALLSFRLYKNSGSSLLLKISDFVCYADSALTSGAVSFSFLDSPASTSTQTYEIYWKVNAGIGYINNYSASSGDTNSNMTLMEIAG